MKMMVYSYIYAKFLDLQQLNMVLFVTETMLHWEVSLGIFTVEIWLITEIMLQSDYLKKDKETVQTCRKTIEDLFCGGKRIHATNKLMNKW